MEDTPYQVYLAGELFSYKALAGNQLLAGAIESHSEQRFKVLLPQSIEMPSDRAKDIRNTDYAAVMASDLVIAQFDGTELDSGTVAEFMLAKQLDIPVLLFRSDFRKSGDQEVNGDAWNLMLSHFPRTESIAVNAMALYHQAGTLALYFDKLAELLLEKLEILVDSKPLIDMDYGQALESYQQALIKLGMPEQFESNELETLVQAKKAQGLL